MTLAQKLMQKIEEEAVRTGSREIKFVTFNNFLSRIDMGTEIHSGKDRAKHFQQQMHRLLQDQVLFDYADSEIPRIHFEKSGRAGGLMPRLLRSLSSRVTTRLRRS